jgi:hypothetical protein
LAGMISDATRGAIQPIISTGIGDGFLLRDADPTCSTSRQPEGRGA